MISKETIDSFCSQFNSGKPEMHIRDFISELFREEPVAIAFIVSSISNLTVFNNPVSTAIAAISIYRKMDLSQRKSQELDKSIGKD